MRRERVRAAWILLAVACGCSGKDAKGPASGPPAVPVVVATAQKADVPVEVRAIGRVEPAAAVVLKPQVAGVVVDIRFTEGADVRAGDALLVLDTRPYEAMLHAAEADLARDTALAEDAKQAAGQIEGALQKSAMSERSAQQAHAGAAASAAVVQRDQASVEKARVDLEYCTVRAPFDGRTGKLLVRRGSAVKVNETELVSLAQIAPIRVAFAVPESRLAEIRKASADAPPTVRVQRTGLETPLEGALTFVDNSVSSTSGTIELMATFENQDRSLWPGEFVQVSVRTGIDRDAVLVPTKAVQTGQKGTYVFVVSADKTAAMRAVRVTRTSGDSSVVADGLQAGEVVVTDGHLRIVPGAHVEASTTAADPAR